MLKQTMAASCPAFSDRVAQLIDGCGMTQRELSRKLDYDNANVISMMKQGAMKLPYAKVPLLAAACGVCPVDLMRAAMREYDPDLLVLLEDMVARAHPNAEQI